MIDITDRTLQTTESVSKPASVHGIDFRLAYETLIAAYVQSKAKMHPQSKASSALKDSHD